MGTVEVKNKLACHETCATDYDSDMNACLQKQSSVTKMSAAKNLDACSIKSSSKMDSCSELCYSSDRYMSWTPERENGEKVDKSVKFSPQSYLAKLAAHKTDGAPEGSLGGMGMYRTELQASDQSSSTGMLSVVALAGVAIALLASVGGIALVRTIITTSK